MKKILSLVACLSLVASLAVGGSIAYLQDQDSAVNVMTLGKVTIEQHEYERATNADGTYKTDTIDNQTSYVLQGFTQAKPLLPIVGDPSEPGESPAYAGWDDTTVCMSQVDSYGGMQVFAGKNAQDKFVTVENTGKSDAFVRTIVAIEVGSTNGDLIATSSRAGKAPAPWSLEELTEIVEIDGNNYMVGEFVYRGASDVNRHVNGILPAGDTTYPSLCQVYLKHNANNDDMVAIDGNENGSLDIIVLSQAVQAQGFENAKIALDTAFGEFNAANVKDWMETDVEQPTIVYTAAELQTALDAAENGATIIFGADITGDVTVTQKENVKITIDGANHKLEGVITVDGKSARYETAGVTIKNINFESEAPSAEAFVNLGKGDNNTRYTNNVTVANCTFTYTGTGKDVAAVKSYTGGDYNTTITGCTVNDGMHSLCQFANIEKGLTITDCVVKSKNGANLNNTPSLNMSGCTFNVKGYAVRFGVNGSVSAEQKTFAITNSTLTTDNSENDAVIIFRDNAKNATLDLTGTTLTGTTQISGNTDKTIISGLN